MNRNSRKVIAQAPFGVSLGVFPDVAGSAMILSPRYRFGPCHAGVVSDARHEFPAGATRLFVLAACAATRICPGYRLTLS
jgi:hypothetical protein